MMQAKRISTTHQCICHVRLRFGLRRWQAAYDAERPAPEVLQQRVDADLAAFDDEVQRERAQRLAMHGATDEEGWVQVRTAPIARLIPLCDSTRSSSLHRLASRDDHHYRTST